jgi:hypothetical protein
VEIAEAPNQFHRIQAEDAALQPAKLHFWLNLGSVPDVS